MERFINRLRNLPATIWFVPAVLVLSGLLLSEILVALDRSGLPTRLPDPLAGFLFSVGPSGASAMVTTVGTAVFGVAGTAFSITMSVIATASSTFGPRLVRNFMADRGNQVVLGAFGATFVYCLMVLRRIRRGDEVAGIDSFVPQLAVNFTLLLAVANVGLLIYFIHHIATSIEVSSLIARARGDLSRVIDRLYPHDRPDRAIKTTDIPLQESMVVEATESGFVAAIYEDSLRQHAVRCGTPVIVLPRPGDHIVAGASLARVDRKRLTDPEAFAEVVRSCIEIQHSRTTEQDIRFCVSRLSEMAVRAMSPGTNDPYTAINAVQELTTALVDVLSRPEPWPGVRDDNDHIGVLIAPRVQPVELVRQVFDEIRPWVTAAPTVVSALIDLGRRLSHSEHPEIDDEVRRQLTALAQQVANSDLAELDRARLLAQIAETTGTN